ncbi:MAG: hypothetical protein IJD97_00350 [Clostridia bacterium]|nr:hypothetical protein [Clostridia bacterium]
MKTTTEEAEYKMEQTEQGFTFEVREKEDYCKVQINYISERGAGLFFMAIKKYRVRACQLTAVAEDSALSAITEIFRGLL